MSVRMDITSLHEEIAKQSRLLATPNKDLVAKYTRLVPILKKKPNATLLEIHKCVKDQKAYFEDCLINKITTVVPKLLELKLLNKETGLFEMVEDIFKARNLALQQMTLLSVHTSSSMDQIELSKLDSKKEKIEKNYNFI